MMGQSTSVLDRIGQVYFREKFNEVGPYYTSYPTLGRWSQAISSSDYEHYLKDLFTKEGKDAPLALYFHIPFCAKLCWYCICNIKITSNRERIQIFLNYLLREIELLKTFFERNSITPNIKEIQLGGGTPSYLDNDQFTQLVKKIQELVDLKSMDEFSMEIDPRTVNKDSLRLYSDLGVTRISFGVQDFDPTVQKAINRVQPPEMIDDLLTPEIRKRFTGVSFDLLYGLPFQTLDTFRDTVEITNRMSPERVSLFKYAHTPDLRKHMSLIKDTDLPQAGDMPIMFTEAVEAFLDKKYEWIGIDHFAKSTDSLAEAVRNKTIGRDFNGWNAGRGKHLIGLGPTSTGAFGECYTQNVYDFDHYYKAIDQNQFPVLRSYKMSKDDAIRRDVIFRILGVKTVDFEAVEQKFNIEFKRYFAEEYKVLNNGFVQEGILEFSGNGFRITDFGRFFCRHVAKVFDNFLKNESYKMTGP